MSPSRRRPAPTGATPPPATPPPRAPDLPPIVAELLAAGIDPPGLLATILDGSDLLVAVGDREGRPLVWNRACQRLSGYSLAELRGRPFFDTLLPPDEAAHVRDVFARLGEREPLIRAENHWITKSGERRLISWSNLVVRGPDGAVAYLVGTGLDVTDQRSAQAEAAASGEQYRMLVEHASDGIFIIDPLTHCIVDANPRGCELLRCPVERLLGRSALEFMEAGLEDAPPVEELRAGRTVVSVVRLLGDDGTPLDAEVGTRMLPDGRAISIVRDVTERRRAQEELRVSEARHRELAERLKVSEAKYRNLHETISDAFVQVDLDGRLLEFNENYERLLGYAPAELRAMSFRDLTPERWWDFEARIVAEQVLPRGWSEVYEKEYRRRDGTVFPVELRTVLVRDEAGAPAGMWAVVRDISARRAAEGAMREAEERYRAVVEQASEGITLTDPGWRFLDVNPRACEMFGYTRDELLRMTVRDLGAPEDLARQPLHTEELRQGGTVTTERIIRRKDGARFTAEISARGLPDGRVVSVIRDITERRQMERALRDSEERARRVIESDMLGILFEQDGRIVDANDYVQRLLGFTRNELLAGGLRSVRFMRPEDAELDEGNAAELRRTGVCRAYERELLRRDGTRVPVLIGGASLGGARESQSVWFVLDLSERKRTERRLAESERYVRRAHELARIGTWDAELESMTAVFSPQMRAIYGLPPDGPPLTFEEFRNLIHPDDWPEMDRVIGGQLKGAGAANYVNRIVRPDGSVRVVEATSESILDEGGRPRRIIGAVRDITEQRALEQQLREAQKLEAIGRLAGGVAHDFNNLLTVILGFSDALLDTLPEGEERASADQIRTAARRAAGLTQQLLAFGRRQRMRLEVFDLHEVLADMRDILRRLLGENIEIVVAPDPRPARVHADRGQLEQVILNLALNARDAMPRGGRLAIATRRAGPPRQPHAARATWVLLEVSDDGNGMSPEVQAHIFEPFFSTKDVGRGTGLGLATVYGIVSQSGGHIDVESAPGRGSTFRVYLPCTESEAEPAPLPPAGAPPRGTEVLLLVEDEAAVRGLVAQVMRSWGYRVLEAPSGEEALELAGKEPPDLLVTDLVMPGMSGSDLAGRLRAVRPGLPVLYISGYTDRAVEAPDGGSVGYLQKPFTPLVLAHKVRALLEGRPGA